MGCPDASSPPRPAASLEEPCSTPPPQAPHPRCLLPGSGWPACAWGSSPTPSSGGPSPGWPATPPGVRGSRRRRPPLSSRPCWRGASVRLPNFPPTYYLAYSLFPWRASTSCTIYCRTGLLDPCSGRALPSWAFAALAAGAAGDLLRGAAGSVILFVFYLILALTSRNGLGMGDVKLAAPLGLYLGYLGWSQLFYGGALAFVAGGLASAVLVAEKPRKQAPRGGLRPLDAGSGTRHHPATSVTPATAAPLTALVSVRIKTSSCRLRRRIQLSTHSNGPR